MWQYFEMRVTTFVAQIIGFADNNNNLDLLLDDATPAWKCRMWLRMLDNPQVTQLGAGEDMEPANSEDLEILVKTYGAHGSAMTGCLPFSWVIKRAIDSFPLASVKWRGGFMQLHISYVVTHSRCQLFFFFSFLYLYWKGTIWPMASFRCHPVTSFVEHSYVITVAYLEFEHWQCFIMLYLHNNFDNTMISCRNLYIYSQKMKPIHTSTYIHI